MTLRRKPRIACPHCGAVYVLEKEGSEDAKVETETQAPEPEFHPLPIRSHDWYAVFFKLRSKPQEKPFNAAPSGAPVQKIVHRAALTMLQQARSGTGSHCPWSERPSEDEKEAMDKIAVGSKAGEAWRKALSDEGYIGFGQDGALYCWVPTSFPPGHDPPDTEDREHESEDMQGEGRA